MAITLMSGQRFAAGVNTAASAGIAVTSGAANTKGNYAELIAATAFKAQGIGLMVVNGVSADDALFDIAIGAALSEQIIIANLLHSRETEDNNQPIFFPIAIPAGTRISAACQTVSGADALELSTYLITGGVLADDGMQKVDTLGAATGDSGGTAVDPGATINTKGTPVQFVASSARTYRWLNIAIGTGSNTARTDCRWLVDICIGAATEQVVIPNLAFRGAAGGDIITPHYYSFPVNIPAGTRISVQAQCSINDATDRLLDVVLYGVS